MSVTTSAFEFSAGNFICKGSWGQPTGTMSSLIKTESRTEGSFEIYTEKGNPLFEKIKFNFNASPVVDDADVKTLSEKLSTVLQQRLMKPEEGLELLQQMEKINIVRDGILWNETAMGLISNSDPRFKSLYAELNYQLGTSYASEEKRSEDSNQTLYHCG